jgi:HSP20 family molecular chaperone IbpA
MYISYTIIYMAGFSDFLNPSVRSFMANELKNIIDKTANGEDYVCQFPFPSTSSSNNLYYCKDTDTLFVELPGMKKSDIAIAIGDDGEVSVKADRTLPFKKSFDYVFNVDSHVVDISSPEAKFDNGILSIIFSRLAPTSKRNINIS